MKKLILLIFVFLTFFFPAFVAFAQEPAVPVEETEEEEFDFASMSTYEMFWPLVPGKVPGDRFYNFKLWRDKLMGLLFFDNVKKSEYLKKLANKRLIETERLIELDRNELVGSTLARTSALLSQGITLLNTSEWTPQAFWLGGEYKKDFQKHVIVLNRMKEKLGGEEAINQALENLRVLIEENELKINFDNL